MTVVFTCGRLNPPTLGHARIIKEVREIAEKEGGEALVFVTKTQDGERNPLAPQAKQEFAQRAFSVPVRQTTSPFSALEELIDQGHSNFVFVVGEDRSAHFQSLVAYASKLGVRAVIRTVSRTRDAESATKAREAALKGDFPTFVSLTPSPHEGYQNELFLAVRRGLLGDEWPK